MPTVTRAQAIWVGSIARGALVGGILCFVLPRLSFAAEVAAEESATPAEDLIPPAPKRPKKVHPPATDWAQWNDVERFRGHYEGRRTADKDRDNGVTAEHGHRLELASGDFEMKAEGSNWVVVTGKISGSIHDTSTSDRWSYHGRTTTDADFSGTASDFHLHLDTTRGHWTFFVNGHMDKPYDLRTAMTSRNWELPVWVADNRSHTEPNINYPHGSFDADLPPGPPTELQAEWRYQNSTDVIIDYQARVILVPEYKDVELIVEIEGLAAGGKSVAYEQWIPRGTVTGAAGSHLKVKARLQAKDGGPAKVHVENFYFTLNDTSREPGVCLNYPLKAAKSAAPDLKFIPGGETDAERQQLDLPTSTDNPEHPHAETQIDCFDFGAWSTLSVTAELADGRTITGHLIGDSGAIRMTLPKRTGGSMIADAWKKEHGITAGDDDDSEKLPNAGKYPGDGFTLYEEYRGFVVNGQHLEGDPEKIDFFVRNFIGGDARPGIGLFAKVTGAEVHDRLRNSEFDETKRVMNANHHQGAHHVDQHGVFLRTDPGRDGAEAFFTNYAVRGRPVLCTRILVQQKGALTPTFTSENVPLADLVQIYDLAIAHELLHAVGVEHHGLPNTYLNVSFMFFDDPRNSTGKPYFYFADPYPSPPPVEITDEKTGRSLAVMLEPDLLLAREVMRPEYLRGAVEFRRSFFPEKLPSGLTERELRDALQKDANQKLDALIGNKSWELGAQHGCCSGAQECLMRYFLAKVYEKEGGWRAYYYISAKRTEHLGFELCRSSVGTGINSSDNKPQSRYGNTYDGWGSCADWIVFNDSAPTEKVPVVPPPPPRVRPTK